MTCKQVQASFDERLDGRVDAAQRETFDAHIASCPTCGREWKAYAALWQTLARHEGVEPSVGFAQRTLRRLDQSPAAARPVFWQLVARWGIAAAVLIGLCVGGWFVRPRAVVSRHQNDQATTAYADTQQADYLEDFDVIASLDQLNGEGKL